MASMLKVILICPSPFKILTILLFLLKIMLTTSVFSTSSYPLSTVPTQPHSTIHQPKCATTNAQLEPTPIKPISRATFANLTASPALSMEVASVAVQPTTGTYFKLDAFPCQDITKVVCLSH